MENKKLTSKRVGVILMAMFLVGLAGFTIYSRVYVQRQRPLVNIAFPESTTIRWTYETRSTIERAAPVYAEQGHEWMIEVYIPLSAFEDYMSELRYLIAEALSDNMIIREQIFLLNRQKLDSGGYIYIYSYDPTLRESYGHTIWPGESVVVFLEYLHLDFDYTLPLSAVVYDPFTGDNYIYTIHRRSGAWGWEYYVRQQAIMLMQPARIGNLANVSPLGGDRTSPVVYWSEWGLYDGALVRLWD